MPAVPARLAAWLAPFAGAFTRPSFAHGRVLVAGLLLAPGRRTVSAALAAVGRRGQPDFSSFHRVLNRNRWKPRLLARRLLHLLVAAFVPEGPVVIGLDETIERRWGRRIAKRGIYRDPVRSSRGHFVKTSGLRWVCVMLLAPIPWAGRVWALPFLTALAPSQRFAEAAGRRHKPLTGWARQLLLLVARWLPGRQVVVVADSSYAAIALLRAVRHRLTMITRLRLDARLFEPPPPRQPGRRGRPKVKGARQPTPAQRLADPGTAWRRVSVTGWYGGATRRLTIASGTAVWDRDGQQLPIRYVLVRDPAGQHEPQAFLCTNVAADPLDILRWFVRRWAVEVTFAEARRHFGLESQRQWSERAIDRTTPTLLALVSLVALWARELDAEAALPPRVAAWYPKTRPTLCDALAAVRLVLWTETLFPHSRCRRDHLPIQDPAFKALIDIACYPA